MKHNYEGCAICDSTWGDVWAEVEGERTFFCCELCALQFQRLVDRIKTATGWARLDELMITGDRRGRLVDVAGDGDRRIFFVTFNPEGDVREFDSRPARGNSG